MKTNVGILLIIVGLVLLWCGKERHSYIAETESRSRDFAGSLQDLNVGLSEGGIRTDTSYKEPRAADYSSAYLLYGIGAISCLLGVFSFALPSSFQPMVSASLPASKTSLSRSDWAARQKLSANERQALGIASNDEDDEFYPPNYFWLVVCGLVILGIVFFGVLAAL